MAKLNILTFSSALVIASFLFFPATALILDHGYGSAVFANDDNDDNATTTDDDDVEDITDINVNSLPASTGKFELKGIVIAVNASSSIISVNGLAVNAENAKIRRGSARTLSDILVGDRVETSGRVENGTLFAAKIVVKGFKGKGVGRELSEDLRREFNQRIQDILDRIQELREKINKKLGGGSSATSTPED